MSLGHSPHCVLLLTLLYFFCVLSSSSGVLLTFWCQGEGRAIAQSSSVMLGEALPSLRLVFQDSHGNVVPVSAEAQPAVVLQVLEAGPGGGGPVMQELQATADLVRCAASMSTSGCDVGKIYEWPIRLD
jgi:hypothetical protein